MGYVYFACGLMVGFGLGFSLGEVTIIKAVRSHGRKSDTRLKAAKAYIPRNEDERL